MRGVCIEPVKTKKREHMILTIDFESFYSKIFSLSKMTTEEYIRSKSFEVIGVAVQSDDNDPVWCSGTKANIKKFLDQFDWANATAVAHNAAFDMAILNWHFDIRPERIIDTLSMARAVHGTNVGGSLAALTQHYNLGAKGTEVNDALGKRRLDFNIDELARYAMYCKNDVVLTYKLLNKLIVDFPVVELGLIDMTVRMFTEPRLELDVEVLTSHLHEVVRAKEKLLAGITDSKEDIMSNPKLAVVLEKLGVVPPMKTSLRTGKQAYAFAKSDQGFKALLEHENPTVQAVVAARLGVKSTLEESRTQRFIDIAGRGTLPIPLKYYAAHTGRWGGDDKINMQNLPRNSLLKHAIRAPDGYMLVDSDSSQIEARTLAWLAEQHDLVEAFERGEDVYKQMASKIYGKPEQDVTKDERFVGKTTILGCGYGMGAEKFQAQLKVFGVETELDECQRIINVYRKTYPKIVELWGYAGDALRAMQDGQTTNTLGVEGVLVVDGTEGIRLPNGLYLRYPNLRREDRKGEASGLVYDTKRGRAVVTTRIYGGKVIENVCQALARIIIGEQMLMVDKRYPVVMTVHDAIGALVPKIGVVDGQRYIEECMRTRPSWALGLPLNCESGVGKTYGDC
jgi:DNA polymerase I-like protein with 3'-5' exonuclease and polymerase domains